MENNTQIRSYAYFKNVYKIYMYVGGGGGGR